MSEALVSLFLSLILFSAINIQKTAFVGNFLVAVSLTFRAPTSFLHQILNSKLTQIKSLPNLESENQFLKKENQRLQILLKQQLDLQTENNILKSQSQFKNALPIRLVTANNLLTFTSSDLSAVKVGQPVVNDQSLIGLVSNVSTPVFTVTPLTNKDFNLDIELDNGQAGNLHYQKDTLVVSGLKNGAAYNENTLVLTKPSTQIPANLVIGKLKQIISSPSDPTQAVSVEIDKTINNTSEFVVITAP